MSTPPLRLLAASATLTAGLVLAGCSSSSGGGSSTAPTDNSSGASGTPSGSASGGASGGASATSSGTTDFTSLLIAASDIPVPGFTLSGTQAAPAGAKGVTALFATSDGGRQVSDILVVTPSTSIAQSSIAAAETAAGSAVADAKISSVDVGDGGKLFVGTTGGKTKATSVVVFNQGKTFVTMDFDSAAGDPLPDSVVIQVAKAQAAKIAANPPS